MSDLPTYETAWKRAMAAHKAQGPHIMLSRILMAKFGFTACWTQDGNRGWIYGGTIIQEAA